jgi:hypothetical protein
MIIFNFTGGVDAAEVMPKQIGDSLLLISLHLVEPQLMTLLMQEPTMQSIVWSLKKPVIIHQHL